SGVPVGGDGGHDARSGAHRVDGRGRRGLHRRLHRVLSRSRDPRPVRQRVARTVGWPPVKTFDELYAELAEKARERPAGSGTVAALDAGVHAIGKKVVEEAAEVWMAAEHAGREPTEIGRAPCREQA